MMLSRLERYFREFERLGTSWKTEIISRSDHVRHDAAYIVFVNPSILSEGPGMPFKAGGRRDLLFCAAFASILMGVCRALSDCDGARHGD